ncbi:hypothetical protein AGRI_08550 [Alishewanella agri BL06]|uniref:Uncharacterized protein n=1 Tax=Alishewanella agri BL06 TaxID=1195246 RepID=I9P1N0_9ALTE|nr:hypothetical protein [Alishewanella agri]EIW88822.1 hypothetical protein AGRI_08550 [Alishewanella agri BL06]
MSTLSEQLLSLALTPVWQPSVESDNAQLLAKLNTAEQALLREKIICFIVTPEPEEPQQPEPDEPDTPEQVPEEVSFNVKLAC